MRQLVGIQYVRGLAALAVALFHFRETFVQFGGTWAIARFANFGYAGVDAFFVIAGFVMVWTTQLELSAPFFLFRRATRIFIGYLPIAISFGAYKYFTNGLDHWVPGGVNVAGSLLLFETDPKRLLIFAAWTLPYELVFYFSFAACLLFGRKGFFYGLITICAIALCISKSGALPPKVVAVITNPIHFEFLLGIALALILNAGATPTWMRNASFALAACFLLAGISGNQLGGVDRVIWLGCGSFFLLHFLIALEQAGQLHHLALLRFLGDASYAVYLLHVPIMYMLTSTGTALALSQVGGAFLLLAFYVTALIVLGSLYHTAIERPLTDKARKLLRG